MARMFSGSGGDFQKAPPKKTRQGRSVNTKLEPLPLATVKRNLIVDKDVVK